MHICILAAISRNGVFIGAGIWCDKLGMWRRHLQLSDGRYVDIVEDYAASDTGMNRGHIL